MPLLSTPRIRACWSGSPVAGMIVPTGANTAFMPACTLGAPHTTSATSLPVSTRQTRSRSALGWRAHLGHDGDPERRQVGAAGLDRFDLEPEHRQLLDDLVEARLGRELLLQPGQRELHRDSPP